MKSLIGALLAVSAFALNACGGDDAPKENAVSLDEWSIDGDLEVPQGSTLQVTNDGTIRHNFVLTQMQTPYLQPGESTTLDLSSLAPGQYEAWCSLPEHRNEGMVAVLTVTSTTATSD
jgi:uncharacterized cupredoxin-like copper-binding protein